jgi:hypothetical protein
LGYARAIQTAPSVTSTNINNGVILAYVRPAAYGANTISQMPIQLYYSNVQTYEIHTFLTDVNKMIILFQNVNNGTVSNFYPTANQYRYIVIPGGVAGGRTAEKAATINGHVYTESTLKSMSYQQVCQLLNIQP